MKNKIGDRSNASSEVEYHDAVGYLIGEHGRGVRTIMDMVALTRLDCATGSAGIMRSAVFSAGLHVSQRKAFGKNLLHQPSMANVLADLEVECAAATHMALAAAAALGCDAGAARFIAAPANDTCSFAAGPRFGNVFSFCVQAKRAQRSRDWPFPSASAGPHTPSPHAHPPARMRHVTERRQVLHLQARDVCRRGGAGVPRRQRVCSPPRCTHRRPSRHVSCRPQVCGGKHNRQAVQTSAVEQYMGGQRQRAVHRHSASNDNAQRRFARILRPRSALARCQRAV